MTKHRKRTWGGQHANARHFRPKTFLMTDKQIEEMQAKLARYREIEARLLALDEPLEQTENSDDNRFPND